MEVFSFFFPSLFSFRLERRNVLAIPKLSTFAFAPQIGLRTCKSKRAKLPTLYNKVCFAPRFLHLAPLSQMQATGVWYSFLNNIFTFNSHKQSNIDNTKQK